MFADMWGVALKILTGVVLVILVLYFVKSYREGNARAKESSNSSSDEKEAVKTSVEENKGDK